MGKHRPKSFKPLYSAVGIAEASQRAGVRLHHIVMLHRLRIIPAVHDNRGMLYISQELVDKLPGIVEKHITEKRRAYYEE